MTPSKQSLKWLSLLLFAQVGLAVGLNLEADRYNSGSGSDTPLLALDTGRVDRLLIEDGEGHKAQLLRQGDHWVLPQAENFPVTPGRVDALLASLAALKAGWPVAGTAVYRATRCWVMSPAACRPTPRTVWTSAR